MSQFIHQLGNWLFWILVGGVALVIVLAALAVGGFYLALIAACCWEKQRVRDFVPATADSLPPPSPYFVAVYNAALAAGFVGGSLFRQDRKSSWYRCSLSLWLSPDQRSILCLCGGKLFGANYRRAFLLSPLADGTYLMSLDSIGVEDISGILRIDVLINADLAELWEFHQSRIAGAGLQARPLDANNLFAEFIEAYRARAQRLVEQGLAKFVSADGNLWKYTWRGAQLYAKRASNVSRLENQQQRRHRKRPGD